MEGEAYSTGLLSPISGREAASQSSVLGREAASLSAFNFRSFEPTRHQLPATRHGRIPHLRPVLPHPMPRDWRAHHTRDAHPVRPPQYWLHVDVCGADDFHSRRDDSLEHHGRP